ncbi:uncharacterized protein BT62DRAFT_1012912 [Guyanagaster necrorhizus]|uniref:Uncharacterized protein n=1 Tax=Guyanagaster necrorhizus TaxID=856835 RepID=A0A9P8AM13_9AGAR|nr:uncharacterized protein BT62DRAFT_1012912 [Guyanagaster necrorhizus MCA 3950]KAG7440254.1 hypothetical protein BT62DRAFT_1012912 [Guyanagaster necrorhizus MCA 3950]
MDHSRLSEVSSAIEETFFIIWHCFQAFAWVNRLHHYATRLTKYTFFSVLHIPLLLNNLAFSPAQYAKSHPRFRPTIRCSHQSLLHRRLLHLRTNWMGRQMRNRAFNLICTSLDAMFDLRRRTAIILNIPQTALTTYFRFSNRSMKVLILLVRISQPKPITLASEPSQPTSVIFTTINSSNLPITDRNVSSSSTLNSEITNSKEPLSVIFHHTLDTKAALLKPQAHYSGKMHPLATLLLHIPIWQRMCSCQEKLKTQLSICFLLPSSCRRMRELGGASSTITKFEDTLFAQKPNNTAKH